LNDLIAAELNVKRVLVLESAGEVVQYRLNPLPAKLGKKFGKDFPRVQKALREGNPADVRTWAKTLLAGQVVEVTLDGQKFQIGPDECEVQQSAAEGYAVAEEAGYLAVLNIRLNDELILEGLAREVVRRIQTMRKDADFDISDRITVTYQASERLAQAIETHAAYIAGETLADTLEAGRPPSGAFTQEFSIDGESLTLSVKKVG
jgi:isoleucyl-tRNA synthetase